MLGIDDKEPVLTVRYRNPAFSVGIIDGALIHLIRGKKLKPTYVEIARRRLEVHLTVPLDGWTRGRPRRFPRVGIRDNSGISEEALLF
jgi:hypothetical protein